MSVSPLDGGVAPARSQCAAPGLSLSWAPLRLGDHRGASLRWSQSRPLISLLRSFSRRWPTWRQHGKPSAPPARDSVHPQRLFRNLLRCSSSCSDQTTDLQQLGRLFWFSLSLFLFILHLSVSVKFKSLGCWLKSRGEGRITGATPDDVRIIIYLNDLGLYFLSLDSCWLEWRESWRSSHTLLKVCMAPQDHILLIILISGWQKDTVTPQVCTNVPHCVVQINQLWDLIQIPCVCLTANGCSDTLRRIKTCFYSHLSSLTYHQMWQTVVAPPKCCCFSQGDSPLCINHSWPSCCAAFWMEHMFAARWGL